MSRRRLPTPTKRNGAQTWEIRFRFSGKIVTRSLGTRDYDEALERVAAIYASLTSGAAPKQVSASTTAKRLTTLEVCDAYASYLAGCEQSFRRERAQAGVPNPAHLAAQHQQRILKHLAYATAQQEVCDYRDFRWYLEYLASTGQGEVSDAPAALEALADTQVTVLKAMSSPGGLASLVRSAATPQKLQTPEAPLLSLVTESYIAERGRAMTGEVALDYRAVVRDLCSLVGDKPVDKYGKADARRLKEALLALPANWRKLKGLRDLSIGEAVVEATARNLKRQSAKTIQMKRTMVRNIFDYAAGSYDDVTNPFADKTAWAVADVAPADQKATFKPDELRMLLTSDLPGELYWLTWLGLCTGARLNELCQLTADHVGAAPHHLFFSPELRLKTRERKSCIRRVPIHPKLIDLGFLDFVSQCSKQGGGRLFPNLPMHRSGKLSDAPSKAFTRHLKRLGIKRNRLSFSSLRHGFSAEFKRKAPLDVETRERLLGHTVKGVAGRYGDDFETEAADFELLRKRAATLAQLTF